MLRHLPLWIAFKYLICFLGIEITSCFKYWGHLNPCAVEESVLVWGLWDYASLYRNNRFFKLLRNSRSPLSQRGWDCVLRIKSPIQTSVFSLRGLLRQGFRIPWLLTGVLPYIFFFALKACRVGQRHTYSTQAPACVTKGLNGTDFELVSYSSRQ